MSMSTSTAMFTSLLLLASLELASANSFRGMTRKYDDMSLSTERLLLDSLERELGSGHPHLSEPRLKKLEAAVEPIFEAMPKNEKGKLDLPSVSYVLRRLFVERHAWFVKGLEPESKSWAAWQDAEPAAILKEAGASSGATHLFESRFHDGLGAHEITVMMATIEHLIHSETNVRLIAAYQSMHFGTDEILSIEEAAEVIDSYMTIYIYGMGADNKTAISPKIVTKAKDTIGDYHPRSAETFRWTREVLKESVTRKRDFFYFADVMAAVEEIENGYGHFQNGECMTLKEDLTKLDKRGQGRVRIPDFYRAALYDGKWEFSETIDYLRKMGALDDAEPTDPKVIIANYINSPSNCLASTSYYQVCCIDECNPLFTQIERKVKSSEATPAQILEIVKVMPSSTVKSGRPLSPWLEQRLHDVAAHHGGTVPLHGRLFHQWMHFAYPQECTYPRTHGETRLQSVSAYAQATNISHVATRSQMRQTVRELEALHPDAQNRTSKSAASMWTMEEELIVARPAQTSWMWSVIRMVMFLLLLGSVATTIKQLLAGLAADEKKSTDKLDPIPSAPSQSFGSSGILKRRGAQETATF